MALELLVPGAYVWLDPDGGPCHPNAAALVDDDGVTVVDTLLAPSQFQEFGDEVESLGLPVRRTVLTSSHLEFAGGTSRFRLAAIYGTRQASTHLDQPPDPDVCRRLYPAFADEFTDDMRTRPVSHVVDAAVQLTPTLAVYPTAGQAAENLVVLAPESQVLFAGAMASFGTAPVCHQGDPVAWAAALDALAAWAPIVVPGHGPIGGEEEMRDLAAYLRACAAADGDPAAIGSGPWNEWTGRHNDVVNVERAASLARGDDAIPPSFLRRAGLA
jgi:glyoxylase-like metal-dependent hydrolase (beta-lactamase superfamily II)